MNSMASDAASEGATVSSHSRRFRRVISATALVLLAAMFAPTVDAQGRGPKGKGKSRRGADDAPKVGAVAPTFKLKTLDGKREVALETFKGKRPVVLIFGSYT